jgi:hypothetical protein
MDIETRCRLDELEREKTELSETLTYCLRAIGYLREHLAQEEEFLEKKQKEKLELDKKILELIEHG